MGRSYHSPKRQQNKQQTVAEILAAAVKLHEQGITDMASVAREAGVSPATVTKYFPTREHLFQGCTAHFLQQNPPPSPAVWAQIEDPNERMRRVVTDLFGMLEAAMGVSWSAYRLADDSPTMSATVQAMESLCNVAARMVVGTNESKGAEENAAFVSCLLSPLTYRSLRLFSGLSPDAASEQTIWAIKMLLQVQRAPGAGEA